jgi:hypothetical protein
MVFSLSPVWFNTTPVARIAALCPSNIGTTVVTALEAFGHDVEQAVRIAGMCFSRGPSGCVCAVMMLIKPAW